MAAIDDDAIYLDDTKDEEGNSVPMTIDSVCMACYQQVLIFFSCIEGFVLTKCN